LGQLQYSIEAYYRINNQLPQTLDVLKENSYSPSESLDKTDPQNKQNYEYTIKSPIDYTLCATFTTDSMQQKEAYDEENYLYETYKNKFSHPQGHHCFDLKVIANPVPTTWPTYEPGVKRLPLPIGTESASHAGAL
jgi:hypothetical protein